MKVGFLLAVCVAAAVADQMPTSKPTPMPSPIPLVSVKTEHQRRKRSVCDGKCQYESYCLNYDTYYSVDNICVICHSNSSTIDKSCVSEGYCWKVGKSVYKGLCYKCSTDFTLSKECHVCDSDICLPRNGSSVTVNDMTYTCNPASASSGGQSTATHNSKCKCIIAEGSQQHEVIEGNTETISCNEWQCQRNSNGSCYASVATAKCKLSDGACVDVGTTDGCNKKCVLGSYGQGKFNYTHCTNAQGKCFAVGESDGCNICGSDLRWTIRCNNSGQCIDIGVKVEKNCRVYECQSSSNGLTITYGLTKLSSRCMNSEGKCFNPGDFDGCNICGNDYNWILRCTNLGQCVEIGTTVKRNCAFYECQSSTSGNTISYGLKKLNQSCMNSEGKCVSAGEHDGCNICGPDNQWILRCNSSGQCIDIGARVEKNCVTYECQSSTSGVTVTYGLKKISQKCMTYNQTCILPGELSKCSVCKQDGSYDVKCQDSAGDCYEPNESKTKNCITYKCFVTGNRFEVKITNKACKDDSGNCHPNGDTWGKCTCIIEGNSITTKCT